MDKKPKAKDAVNPFAKIEASKAKSMPAKKPAPTGYKKPAPAPKTATDYFVGGLKSVGDYLRGVSSKKK